MDEKRTRQWFQFHLTTAITTMIAAAVVLFGNVRQQYVVFHATGSHVGHLHTCYGWPMFFHYEAWQSDEIFSQLLAEAPYQLFPNGRWKAVAVDGICGIGIVVSVALLSESLIRRRKGRTP
jgi:hypothetical protein